jgi:hypothetical protein
MQRPIQDEPGVVARERAAGPVRPMLARCEADDEQPMARAAERRDGTAVIVRMLDLDPVEKPREARTQAAVWIERRAARKR